MFFYMFIFPTKKNFFNEYLFYFFFLSIASTTFIKSVKFVLYGLQKRCLPRRYSLTRNYSENVKTRAIPLLYSVYHLDLCVTWCLQIRFGGGSLLVYPLHFHNSFNSK